MRQGFVTIATGDERYYHMALNLLHSYRQNCSQPMRFALIADRHNAFTEEFDDVVILENIKQLWRIAVAVLLILWFLAVVWNTLLGRENVSNYSASSFVPFHSYYVVLAGGERELLRSNFMNVILFYPGGLLVCELLPRSWGRARKVILVAVLLALVSVGIEFCQYHFALGQAEVDDVIHNALGALVGALISAMPIPWTRGKPGNDPHPHGIGKT